MCVAAEGCRSGGEVLDEFEFVAQVGGLSTGGRGGPTWGRGTLSGRIRIRAQAFFCPFFPFSQWLFGSFFPSTHRLGYCDLGVLFVFDFVVAFSVSGLVCLSFLGNAAQRGNSSPFPFEV